MEQDFYLDSEWNADDIPFLPQLKTINNINISTADSDFHIALINKHSQQIESLNLGLDEDVIGDISIKLNKLINLKEFKYSLRHSNISYIEMNFWKIVNDANILSVVSARLPGGPDINIDFKTDKWLNKLLTTQQHLELIEIDYYYYNKNNIYFIENGMNVLRSMKKKKLVVRINFQLGIRENELNMINEIIDELKSWGNKLNKYNVNHFVIHINITNYKHKS
eukprot:39880_1